jgi:predicted RecA/RadA family phage recombinase
MKNQVQEGKVLTFLESDLVHPTHTDGFVKAGDPCVVGTVVGVAFESALAETDKVDLATGGVFNLSVHGVDKDGNAAVAGGDKVYISGTTAVLSKDVTGAVVFGKALGAVSGGATTAIPVLLVQV